MAIEVKKLTKEYSRGGKVFKAVNEVDLTLNVGDFLSIIGRSGSGKSTLLNLIAGLINKTSGSVEVDGDDIAGFSDKTASIYRNTKIGYIPQGQSALSSLTVLDNIRLPFHLFKKSGESEQLAFLAVERVGISHLVNSYPKQLSGGELKRVAIARALINSPKYIIADEPTRDLDAETTSEILTLLADISRNNTAVLMVTHDLDALDYAGQTYVMDAGVLKTKNMR